MKRIVKQSIIVMAVILFLGALAWGIFWITRTKPTCFDGIKNGEEEGTDCGVSCSVPCDSDKPEVQKVKVDNFEIIRGGNNKCDLLVTLENPNNSLVGQHIPYSFKWGENFSKEGEFYIYPSEKRYLAEYNLPCNDEVKPEFRIEEAKEWDFFKNFTKPELQISDSNLNYLEDPHEFAEVKGKLINKSAYTLKTVEIFALVKDQGQNVLAVNQTTVNSIESGQVRDFRIFWTHSFPKGGNPSFYVTTNLFNSQNFIREFDSESTRVKEQRQEYEF